MKHIYSWESEYGVFYLTFGKKNMFLTTDEYWRYRVYTTCKVPGVYGIGYHRFETEEAAFAWLLA